MDGVSKCISNLMEGVSGITNREQVRSSRLYKRNSVVNTTEFIEYVLSVIYVESRFRSDARSDKEAYGLMQMTSIAVEDAVEHCGLRPLGSGGIESLFDTATNITYGSCYLKKVLEEADGDWTRALILYNGGYAQLMRYDRGDQIVTETANYVLRVQRAHSVCVGK